MVAVEITPWQSVRLFGWFNQPTMTLCWKDVKQHSFTWRQMRTLDIQPEQLKIIQPSVAEWIQRGGIMLTDIPDMTVFPVNPLTDFGVDLSELWSLKCDCATMRRMGITYDHLVEKGITPQIMKAFNITLSSWVDLGFSNQHAAYFSDSESMHVFALPRTELLNIVTTFAPPRSLRPIPEASEIRETPE